MLYNRFFCVWLASVEAAMALCHGLWFSDSIASAVDCLELLWAVILNSVVEFLQMTSNC